MAKQTKGEVKIEGQSQTFRGDYRVMSGLFKTQIRKNIRENIKRFKFTINPPQDKNSMGVRFHKMPGACIIHISMGGSPDQQLLVSKDLNMKEMRKLPLNKTYQKLITQAFELSGGKEKLFSKNGILKSITDVIT